MNSTPIYLYLSLRYDHNDSIFSDASSNVYEETHIIPVYDCYFSDVPQGKRGDEYCHYYIRDYVNSKASDNIDFSDMIDPKLKVCCRNGEIFYSDSNDKFFKRLEGIIMLAQYSPKDKSERIIGSLEEMNITL